MSLDKRAAILGGTFTPIHNGHRALLHKAFQTACYESNKEGHVIIALTSTSLASRTRSDPSHADHLGSFENRYESLDSELDCISDAYSASYEIIKLEDTYGPAVTRMDIDALIVSPEAEAQSRAYELNEQRIKNGLSPLEIHTAPFVFAEDGDRISSTRIREGEIDTDGFVLDSTD